MNEYLLATIKRLRELETQITKGPWKWVEHGQCQSVIGYDNTEVLDDGSAGGEYGQTIHSDIPDGQYIVESRNHLPLLLDTLESQAKEIEICVEALQKLIVTCEQIMPNSGHGYLMVINDLHEQISNTLEQIGVK